MVFLFHLFLILAKNEEKDDDNEDSRYTNQDRESMKIDQSMSIITRPTMKTIKMLKMIMMESIKY